MGGYRTRKSRLKCTYTAISVCTMTWPTISSTTSAIKSLPLSLPLPQMGCIRDGVDDTGGLVDGPCDVEAS